MSKKILIPIGAITIIVILLIFHDRGVPFVGKKYRWSIGIYKGSTPMNIAPADSNINPVLTSADVTDVDADFVADPFMVKVTQGWVMFFEVLNSNTRQGDIGYATSVDGLVWNYEKIVLDEAFHLSYPYVFKSDNDYYMIPETHEVSSVRLYKSVDFPSKWEHVNDLVVGKEFLDNSIFKFDDIWWIFTGVGKDVLHLFYSKTLTGEWIEHPMSPIVSGDPQKARPAGRVIEWDGKLIRFAQDGSRLYGEQVWAYEITDLSTTTYKEKLLVDRPILKPSANDWNSLRMHHVDLHLVEGNVWLGCVDGLSRYILLGLKY